MASNHGSIQKLARSVLRALEGSDAAARGYDIVRRDKHSNDVDEVHLEDGRVLIVKRARVPGMAPRFRVSRLAARLVRERTGLLAPDYLSLPPEIVPEDVLVYWWIPNPTLREVLASAPVETKAALLRDWGRAMRALHGVALAGHGSLERGLPEPRSLETFLEADLSERLRPAVAAAWSEGLVPLDGLRELVPAVAAGADVGAVLVHNDLFEQNILCGPGDGDAVCRCVGVLDLEDAFAGPREADLAKTEVLHGPLFGQPWRGDWFDRIRDGYGGEVDETAIAFFRVYHLLNMGYFAALTGHGAHSSEVARAAARELGALGSGRRHADVVGEP